MTKTKRPTRPHRATRAKSPKPSTPPTTLVMAAAKPPTAAPPKTPPANAANIPNAAICVPNGFDAFAYASEQIRAIAWRWRREAQELLEEGKPIPALECSLEHLNGTRDHVVAELGVAARIPDPTVKHFLGAFLDDGPVMGFGLPERGVHSAELMRGKFAQMARIRTPDMDWPYTVVESENRVNALLDFAAKVDALEKGIRIRLAKMKFDSSPTLPTSLEELMGGPFPELTEPKPAAPQSGEAPAGGPNAPGPAKAPKKKRPRPPLSDAEMTRLLEAVTLLLTQSPDRCIGKRYVDAEKIFEALPKSFWPHGERPVGGDRRIRGIRLILRAMHLKKASLSYLKANSPQPGARYNFRDGTRLVRGTENS